MLELALDTAGCAEVSGGHSRRKKRLSKRTGANGGVTQRPA